MQQDVDCMRIHKNIFYVKYVNSSRMCKHLDICTDVIVVRTEVHVCKQLSIR